MSLDKIQNGLLSLYTRERASQEHTRIVDLTRISDGWETDVYAFTVEHGRPGEQEREDLILRLYPGDDAADKSGAEFSVMRKLYQAGYPVPQVLRLEQEDALFGHPIVVMERIRGRPMGTVVDESPMEKKLELLALFCQMFVDLHALDWRPFATAPPPDKMPGLSAVIGNELSQWQDYLRRLQRSEFDPIFRWLWERLPGVSFGQPSVIHGDYHPWNILLREDGTAYVIDWTNAAVSDYRVDLAWTLLLMSTYGSSEPREIVLGEYERTAGAKVEQIGFFDVMACLRRLATIMISLGSGAEKLGMRPGAEAMMKNVGHIEGVYALLRERTSISIPAVDELLLTLHKSAGH